MPGRGGRTPSAPWGRLKPAVEDHLESIGLPSKGDSRSVLEDSPWPYLSSSVGPFREAGADAACRLLDGKTQEKYYTKVVERYMAFCTDAGQRDELLRRFASLEISEKPTGEQPSSGAAGSSPSPSLPVASQSPADDKILPVILAALRKLREGIVASKRADDFAIQAYLFSIRLAILVKQPESYHPAILHLLRVIHPEHPLTSLEVEEVAGYLTLDAACRRGDLEEAFELRKRFRLRDGKVAAVLRALARDNYVLFMRVKRTVDGHKAKMMEWAEGELRLHALKCFSRAYLSVDLYFLEATMGARWEDLRNRDGVGWELDGRTVTIRRVKAKP